MNSDNGQQVTPQSIVLASLTALVGAGGPYHLCTLVLNAANVIVTPLTPLAALTPPTFTGYAPVAAIAFAGPYNTPNGGGGITAPSVLFECTGGTPSDTIYGWGLADSGLTTLKFYCPLNTPVQIANSGDAVLIQPEIDMSGR